MNHSTVKENLSSRSGRILVVEDNPLIQRIHLQLLQGLGCHVDCVTQGQDALRQLTYDLVFVDLGLPDISGEMVIEMIRAREAKRKRIPIIVVSAHGKEQELQCLTLGADQVLTKPVKIEDFRAILGDYNLLEKQ
ncbi:putative sensory histidine-kinase / response regulator [Candidatus Rickettsiella viridis]|uniref:Putative sensory histidine-kinase / response regulator n=1 Tax=Candidatus Rickettsiella viridis TaxID=676208 RepID=A0A2Z5UV04_9COXI|nr:response regulator [Candidatus Rickettsiella viridis]BBB14783.1 putative sensory histidine-kinase / response regulator [Candidatus Rickettsiella viridis]BBB15513.1 putative sensory histidine-kinase / response regulator [Candidatus Rickettsiella viridis]